MCGNIRASKSRGEHWPRELCLRRELWKVSMESKAMSSAAARVGGMESAKHSALRVATKHSARALSYGLAVAAHAQGDAAGGGQPRKGGGGVLAAAVTVVEQAGRWRLVPHGEGEGREGEFAAHVRAAGHDEIVGTATR